MRPTLPAPPPEPTPPAETAAATRATAPAGQSWPGGAGVPHLLPEEPRIGLQRVVVRLSAAVLSLVGPGLAVPVQRALALLPNLVPLAVLRRLLGAAVPK